MPLIPSALALLSTGSSLVIDDVSSHKHKPLSDHTRQPELSRVTHCQELTDRGMRVGEESSGSQGWRQPL